MSDKKVVITMARQIGSGGAYVAQRLAKRLNFKYIDKEIVVMLAHKLDTDVNYLKSKDEKKSSILDNIFRSFSIGAPGVSYTPPNINLIDDKMIFEIQVDIIRNIANKGNVIIVGRAGFYILKDYENLISMFIHADRPFRVKRMMDIYNAKTEDEANKLIDKIDEQRRAYTKTVTGLDWYDLKNYKLAFNSASIGLTTIEDFVYDLVMKKLS